MSKRILSAALALVLLCLSLGAGAETLTITDMTGRDVTLPQAARRIVALTASNVEILYAIGAGSPMPYVITGLLVFLLERCHQVCGMQISRGLTGDEEILHDSRRFRVIKSNS